MRLVITGGESRLAKALAAAFTGNSSGREHTVRLTGLTGQPASHADPATSASSAVPGARTSEWLTGDLRDPAFAARVLDGMDAVFHLAPLWPGLPEGTPDEERLDHAARGTYVLCNEAARHDIRRVVLASTLDLFDRYPASWRTDENWQPRPSTDAAHLAAFLAESSAREISRVEPLVTVCLRLGRIVDDHDVARQPYDPRWLHVDDAAQAFERALVFAPTTRETGMSGPPTHGWWLFHIPGGGPWTRGRLAAAGQQAFGYRPAHGFSGGAAVTDGATGAARRPAPTAAEASGDQALLAPRAPVPSRPIRKVVIFGAGGPLSAATVPLLRESYTLRLTDVQPLEAIAGAPQRRPDLPLVQLLPAPHEIRQVDVTNPAQVLAACEGMDAIVNCTVVRPDPVQAFRVNCIGAYNVIRAAVACGIRRVVHTGPQVVSLDYPGGYWWDFDVPSDVPPRPGVHLYHHTKFLGQELCRIFAEEHDLEVPVLHFSTFVNPDINLPRQRGLGPLSVSWNDAGHAMRRALEVPAFPSPYEVMHILADLPHGKFSNAKAKRLLGWQPRDTLAHLWADQE